jgi:hypothetical protein
VIIFFAQTTELKIVPLSWKRRGKLETASAQVAVERIEQ